jgi:hypothetical protein
MTPENPEINARDETSEKFQDATESAGSMEAAAAMELRDISPPVVTQHPAGCLVDEVYAGAGRTAHGFITIRMIRRRGIGHKNLNIDAGPRAAKY